MIVVSWIVATSLLAADDKLNFEERVEITRGLMAEYATAKVVLPRSGKALGFDAATGKYDKAEWADAGKTNGPAARVGDLVQVTKVDLENDKIVLQINGGMKSGRRKWYEHIEVGMGGNTSPVNTRQNTNAPGGTSIALQFDKKLTAMKASDVKKLLAPILDFEKRSATEAYVENLPPEVKQAIQEKKAIEGMDRDQVLLALGVPRRKTRETKDGYEQEDWIYGEPPGKLTFVTFRGTKVFKVKDVFAGLGGSTVPATLPPD